MDYYKILKIDENASLKEIEQAYLDLASFYNPKNNFSKLAYKRFREVNEAYRVLNDLKQRELYNLTRKPINEDTSKETKGECLSLDDFKKEHFESDNEEKYLDRGEELDAYTFDVPYLFYLVKAEYTFDYHDDIFHYLNRDCSTCLGSGVVKHEEKLVTCPSCKGKGKEAKKEEHLKELVVEVNDVVIDKNHNLVVYFNFPNKGEYEVDENHIYIRHEVTRQELEHGFFLEVKKGDEKLQIINKDYKELKQVYKFLDFDIEVEYVINDELAINKTGYLLCDREVVYLDPNDFTYTYTSDNTHTLELPLNSRFIELKGVVNSQVLKNKGDLKLEVIKIKNEEHLSVFFDYTLRKVSANLFKVGGYFNHHYLGGKTFAYDEKYLYIPSLAYKNKMKNYLFFRILVLSIYALVPLILFFTIGISTTFFMINFIYLVMYLALVNILMEVKL